MTRLKIPAGAVGTRINGRLSIKEQNILYVTQRGVDLVTMSVYYANTRRVRKVLRKVNAL